MSRPVIIIGYGAQDRGDDAAGLMVARRLRALLPAEVPVREVTGDGASLMSAWEGYDTAIVADAIMSGGESGSVRKLDVPQVCACEAGELSSSHAFGLREAVSLAAALDTLPRRLVVVGIEAGGAELGMPVTRAVREGIERAARNVRDEVIRCRPAPDSLCCLPQ